MAKSAAPWWRRGKAIGKRDMDAMSRRGVAGVSVTGGGVSQVGNGGGVGIVVPGQIPYRPLVRMRVKSQENDYIWCTRWDGVTEIPTQVQVAKPWKLRHDKDHYAGLTTLTTTSAGEVDVGDGSDTETWVVTPSYEVDDEIYAEWVPGTGVSSGGVDLRLIDRNLDGRAWAKKAT